MPSAEFCRDYRDDPACNSPIVVQRPPADTYITPSVPSSAASQFLLWIALGVGGFLAWQRYGADVLPAGDSWALEGADDNWVDAAVAAGKYTLPASQPPSPPLHPWEAGIPGGSGFEPFPNQRPNQHRTVETSLAEPAQTAEVSVEPAPGSGVGSERFDPAQPPSPGEFARFAEACSQHTAKKDRVFAVWGAKAGDTARWRSASARYDQWVSAIELAMEVNDEG